MCSSPLHKRVQIVLPLNPIFKGHDAVAGHYSVYLHSIQTEVPIGYVGMTKQRWFDRYAQHVSSARTGSPLLFHQALRTHLNEVVLHRVFISGLSHELALEQEEEWVGMFGLYPLGLNMIPGGKVGFAYLAKLGLNARNAEERDALMERLSTSESLEGRPNPLCAARWATDRDFAERIICGHPGHLTLDQVRMIRLGNIAGRTSSELLQMAGAKNVRQVQNVIAGKTYSRV